MLARRGAGCKLAGMRIFVLTGAGVSAESGLSTFRDATGIWTRVDFREVATPEGFARDPAKVHAFYNARRANLLAAEPNAAHRALAKLQAGLAARGDELWLCTQNVDDLHERVGVTNVVHMHGELRTPTSEINLEPSETAELFEERIYGRASEEVPAWVERVLAAG